MRWLEKVGLSLCFFSGATRMDERGGGGWMCIKNHFKLFSSLFPHKWERCVVYASLCQKPSPGLPPCSQPLSFNMCDTRFPRVIPTPGHPAAPLGVPQSAWFQHRPPADGIRTYRLRAQSQEAVPRFRWVTPTSVQSGDPSEASQPLLSVS